MVSLKPKSISEQISPGFNYRGSFNFQRFSSDLESNGPKLAYG